MSRKKTQTLKQVEPERAQTCQTPEKSVSFECEKTLVFIREIIETFAIAFVLALLFKTFEGELFGIPTGSMAPTLMGRHKDLTCPECGCPYQVSASEEFDAINNKSEDKRIIGGTCPQCRFTTYFGMNNPYNKKFPSFAGDHILVDKFSLNFRQPRRWEVTVFRFPGDPQTSYIKRFAGLENESLQIHNGNLYVKKEGDDRFHIVRKERNHLLAMLQTVYDTQYVNPEHVKAGFPARWHTDTSLNVWHAVPGSNHTGDGNPAKLISEVVPITHQNGIASQTVSQAAGGWQMEDDKSFQSTPTGEMTWLNYRHCIPVMEDWHQFRSGTFHADQRPIPPQLVTDFTAYNTGISVSKDQQINVDGQAMQWNYLPEAINANNMGVNWVGDLALEAQLTVEQPQGELVFELVSGGVAFNCSIEPATGKATLSIPGNPDFEPCLAETPVKGTGSWRVLFANVDDQLRLFVDSREIAFSGDGCYSLPGTRRPTVLDLTPAAVGAKNAQVRLDRLILKRDIYYIATDGNPLISCDNIIAPSFNSEESLRNLMSDPNRWESFGKTRTHEIKLGKGEFFALGDNTAKSSDSRMWAAANPNVSSYVPEKFLIGRAIFVAWPHGLPIPGTSIPVIPNVGKMRSIN
ncbi:MAG: S26 family signal peptidase [Planctomycetaceae bacterium]|nr:S26 family signal peptidase [Planctomycetaceae bacterium]